MKEKEKDSDEYLITAENYQGITVINCSQHLVQSWLLKSAKEGTGFCFSSVEISPNGKYLLMDVIGEDPMNKESTIFQLLKICHIVA